MNAYRFLPNFVLGAAIAMTAGIVGCNSNPPAAPAPVAGQTPAGPDAAINPNQSAPVQSAEAPNRREARRGTEAERQPAYAPAPVVRPAPVERAALVAPAGTRIVVRTNETLSAGRNEVGDGFSGTLEEPVIVRDATLFPAGTRVSGTVIAAKGRGRFKGEGAIGIELSSIGSVRVRSSEYEKASSGKGKRTGTLIGGGAGLGALIGGLAGGGKGAVIGGLAGAGAGTAGAAYTGNKDVVIPSESVLTFSLVDPVEIRR